MTSQHCFMSLETNKPQNLILKCCKWGPGIGSTSHCLSTLENTKSCLKLFFHSPENIAIAYLQKNTSVEYINVAEYVFSLLWQKKISNFNDWNVMVTNQLYLFFWKDFLVMELQEFHYMTSVSMFYNSSNFVLLVKTLINSEIHFVFIQISIVLSI